MFAEIWVIDWEFGGDPGNPDPRCVTGQEVHSGRQIRLWRDQLNARTPPYRIDEDVLVVAYYASAEMGCHLAMGWDMPKNLIDAYAEHRVETNGLRLPLGNGLLAALAYYGEPGIDAIEKDAMRDLAIRGGVYSDNEKNALLDYCKSDVEGLGRLWKHLAPVVLEPSRLPLALLRGRYMKAAAAIERNGIPVDAPLIEELRQRTGQIETQLINQVDKSYGVFEGGHFRHALFAKYLESRNIPWPVTPSGRLATDDDTFKEMSRTFPELQPLRELRRTLGQLSLDGLVVRADSRNAALLSAFRATTGRNQPSNAAWIFGLPSWMRGLIRPEPRRALAYVDWSQQEFGIAAALSTDPAMMDAYTSADPYLTFAKQAGAIGESATKASHPEIRDQFKCAVLATQYGQGPESLAKRIRKSPAHARELLEYHRKTYPVFWRWSDAVLDFALTRRRLTTNFGWQIHVGSEANTRSLRNFVMQATGAEILRIACVLAFESGIQIAAPVHDAVLIEAPTSEIDDAVALMQKIMQRASEVALGGFSLRSDAKLIHSPGRFLDERGAPMWELVNRLLRSERKKIAEAA